MRSARRAVATLSLPGADDKPVREPHRLADVRRDETDRTRGRTADAHAPFRFEQEEADDPTRR